MGARWGLVAWVFVGDDSGVRFPGVLSPNVIILEQGTYPYLLLNDLHVSVFTVSRFGYRSLLNDSIVNILSCKMWKQLIMSVTFFYVCGSCLRGSVGCPSLHQCRSRRNCSDKIDGEQGELFIVGKSRAWTKPPKPPVGIYSYESWTPLRFGFFIISWCSCVLLVCFFIVSVGQCWLFVVCCIYLWCWFVFIRFNESEDAIKFKQQKDLSFPTSPFLPIMPSLILKLTAGVTPTR